MQQIEERDVCDDADVNILVCICGWAWELLSMQEEEIMIDWAYNLDLGRAKDMTDVYKELLKEDLFQEYHLQQRMIFIKWLWSLYYRREDGDHYICGSMSGLCKAEVLAAWIDSCLLSLQLHFAPTWQWHFSLLSRYDLLPRVDTLQGTNAILCHDSAKTQRNRRVSLCSSSFSSLVQQQSNLIVRSYSSSMLLKARIDYNI